MKRHDLRILLLILTCLLAACAAVPTPSPTLPPPTSSPTRPPASTSTPRPTATLTATTEPTADLALAREKWLIPIGGTYAIYSACVNAPKVVEDYQAKRITDEGFLSRDLAIACWGIGVGLTRLNDWDPPEELEGHKKVLYDLMKQFGRANGQFLVSKDAVTYLATIAETCLANEKFTNEVTNQSMKDGLTMQDSLDLFELFMTLPLDTSTPTPDVQHP